MAKGPYPLLFWYGEVLISLMRLNYFLADLIIIVNISEEQSSLCL